LPCDYEADTGVVGSFSFRSHNLFGFSEGVSSLVQGVDLILNQLKYYNVVLLLLSSPLPEGTSLPAAALEFFVHLTKTAIETPTLPAFLAVYSILSGACKNLPRTMPKSAVDRLQEDLSRIVKNGKTLHEQRLPVVCLGILALLIPSSLSPGSSRGHPRAQSPASSFFSGTSAFRSMGLAILQALWNCKSSRVSSTEEAASILDISINIFNSVEPGIRDAWSKSDAGGVNTERIRKKCSEDDVDPQNRLKVNNALRFAVNQS
jgi:hypothetical protein